MRVIYDKVKDGIRILRWFGYDGQVEIPERICGNDVKELGPYAFSQTLRRVIPGEKFQGEISWGEGESQREVPAEEALLKAETLADGTPALQGDMLCSVSLPPCLQRVGAYAFYNCGNLERLRFWGGLEDLGAGLFTGCARIRHLEVFPSPQGKSCLKEVLSELRQTLRVSCLDEQGEVRAKLLFPEYYEESVENTPARILTQEMHGCGHRYRNAFSGTEFQYLAYDRLFPHIQVQEKPELVAELVLGRLMYPIQLDPERKTVYEEYAASHGRELFLAAEKGRDLKALQFIAASSWCTVGCLDEMIQEGRRKGDAQALGILMDARGKRPEGGNPARGRKQRFTL